MKLEEEKEVIRPLDNARSDITIANNVQEGPKTTLKPSVEKEKSMDIERKVSESEKQKDKEMKEEPILKKEEKIEASSIFEDLELPTCSNFFENEEAEWIFPKGLGLIQPNFLHNRLVKVVSVENDMVKILTRYLKKKQKNQKFISLSDNTTINLEEDMMLMLQEPAFYPIESQRKFETIVDENALKHFQEDFNNLAFFCPKSSRLVEKKVVFWPVLVFQNYSRKNAVNFVVSKIGKISDDSYLNLECSEKKGVLVVECSEKKGVLVGNVEEVFKKEFEENDSQQSKNLSYLKNYLKIWFRNE